MLDVQRELRHAADPAKAAFFPRFFKTGKGEYGEGDRFLGLTVPAVRAIARRYREASARDVSTLLASPWHEERLSALFIWVDQYKRGDAHTREAIVRRYLDALDRVNNWDLVDASAHHILGAHIVARAISVRTLDTLSRSGHLWRERVAIVATLACIRVGQFAPTLRIAERYCTHPHDLIHKATGWMLRELGKRDDAVLRTFLDAHAARMPRTMLRYAIERFPERVRRRYLSAK